MKSLNEYIQVYDTDLTSEFCEDLIHKFEINPTRHEMVSNEKRPNFTQMNLTNYIYNTETYDNETWDGIHKTLQNAFLSCVKGYIEDTGSTHGLPTRYALEEFRMKRYLDNGIDEFATHVDVLDYNSARRFLAFFLYLNDGFEGGETDFPNLGLTIRPKRGSILVFPPLWMFEHSGKPVTFGTKYIVGSYLHYI